MRSLLLALAFSLVACAAPAQDEDTSSDTGAFSAVTPITVQNYRDQPAIKEVDAMVDAVDRKLDSLTHVDKEGLCSGRLGEDTRELVTIGVAPSRLVLGGISSSDSYTKTTYNYDAKGVLRFVFVYRQYVNRSSVQRRIYFDAKGKRLFEVQRSVMVSPSGDSATYPDHAVTDPLTLGAEASKPREWFDSPAECN